MADSFAVIATTRIVSGLVSGVSSALLNAGVIVWDLGLTAYNAVAPLRPADGVVPHGCPGAGGNWPQYVPPGPGDSRCACPALNAMANHGLLPHDGHNISFRQMNAAIRTTFNFAPTFCFFVPNYMAGILNKSYWSDTLDLADISVHNGIEHDASLTREDSFHDAHQGEPSRPLIEQLLKHGTGPGGNITAADLSRLLGKRRRDAQEGNGQFSLSGSHKLFGSSNASTLVTIFGGDVKDLEPILLEERIPEGWQPRIRNPAGLTLTKFQRTVLRVELGIKEEVESLLRRFGVSGDKKTA